MREEKEMKKAISKTKTRTLKGVYRWFKRYYLPALHRRIENLPAEVAMLANTVDRNQRTFYLL